MARSKIRLKTLPAIAIILFLAATPALSQQWWRAVIVRSKQEYSRKMIGGEATQHMQGAARSLSEPDIIYLSHDCAQVWRSNDNGKSWLKCRGEGMYAIAGQSIEVDPVNPDKVICMVDSCFNYMVKKSEGLYLSLDGGDTWKHVLAANTKYQRFGQKCIAWAPESVSSHGAQKWYAAIAADHFYTSTDSANTWKKSADISEHEYIYAISASGESTVYLAGSNGLFKSVDSGETFKSLGNLPKGAVSSICTDPRDEKTIYAVVLDNGLYISTDSGKNFTLLVSKKHAMHFSQNQGHPDIMYLSGNSGQMIFSSNSGKSWAEVKVAAPLGLGREWMTYFNGSMTNILPDPRRAGTCSVYSNATAWKTNNGRNFHLSADRLTGFNWGWWADSTAYDISDPKRFVFFCFDVSMAITENGGKWFERVRTPYQWYKSGKISWISMHSGDIYPETGSDRIAVAGGMTFDLKMMLTTNCGKDLSIVDNEEHYNLLVAFNTNKPNIVYAGKKRSTDAGESYQTIDFLDDHDAIIVGVSKSNPDTLYAIGDNRQSIFRSDDTGISWRVYCKTSWPLGRMDSRPGAFDVDPENPGIIYALDAVGDIARYDGKVWESLGVVKLAPIPTDNNFVKAVKVDPRHREIIYAQMSGAGSSQVFRSTDSGSSWQDITYNLPLVGGSALSVHPLTGDVMVSNCSGTRLLPAPYQDAASLYKNLTPDPPVAKAGNDIIAYTDKNTDAVSVKLTGSASIAPDSNIVKSTWSLNGKKISSELDTVVELSTGKHLIRLEIVDNNSIKAFDHINVEIKAAQ